MREVSVIIPTYNSARYVGEALLSVLGQTLRAAEIIVVDDGSVDNTEEVVRSLGEDTIVYSRQENAGVSAARNSGLAQARAEYVAFLDADDRWRPRMLEEQSAVLDDHAHVVFSFTNFIRFDEATGAPLAEQFEFFPELEELKTKSTGRASAYLVEGDAFSALVGFGEIPAFTPAIMFRREAIQGLEFDPTLQVCEDTDFVLRAATRGAVAFNREVLLEVRRHDRNATVDTSLVAVDKLRALERVGSFAGLTSLQLAALERRLSKAYVDAATAEVRAARYKESLGSLGHFWRGTPDITRRVRGGLRWLLELAVSAMGRVGVGFRG